MTREEEAKAVLSRHLLHAAMAGAHMQDREWSQTATIAAMIEFAGQRANAEAAAMRERAAGAATAAAEAARPYSNGVGLGPATEKHRMLEAERIAAAIRALPATGEVGRG